MKFKELKLRKNPDCVICGPHPTITKLIDYEAFCGVAEELSPDMEVTARQLKDWMDQKKDIVVVDVREPWEYEINHIEGSRLIPLAQLPERMNELSTADQIVVQCASGIRSAQATRFLNSMGFKKAKNLKGGIKAWGQEVDPLMPMY
jgi:adenylyltransferase/sulfurtransferase